MALLHLEAHQINSENKFFVFNSLFIELAALKKKRDLLLRKVTRVTGSTQTTVLGAFLCIIPLKNGIGVQAAKKDYRIKTAHGVILIEEVESRKLIVELVVGTPLDKISRTNPRT